MEERVRVDRGVWMSVFQSWEMADGCVDGMVCGREGRVRVRMRAASESGWVREGTDGGFANGERDRCKERRIE